MASSKAGLTVVVLAAGQGTRLRSKTIKLLHDVAGRPMVQHVVESARGLKPSSLVLVVGFQADRVREATEADDLRFALQREQRGTGHAVLQAARYIEAKPGSVLLILNGDVPTLRVSTLKNLVSRHRRSGAALSLLTAAIDDPTGYGRVLRDNRGQVDRIVEHKDASTEEREVNEINCGMYCADPKKLLTVLRKLRPDNAQGEYYITDAVRALIGRGEKVRAVLHDDAHELLGVNSRQELAHSSTTLYARKAAELQAAGVTLLDAERTRIDPRARVARDTVIHPDVAIDGATVIGEDCEIRSGTRLTDSRVGRGVLIRDHCVVDSARIGDGATVGPFAHLRPGTDLGADTRIGNFVELKKTKLGRGSKANHLAYLGDATIGPDCNIGAGTITCNYDGTFKNPSILGKGVFIGSDSQLVAPVRVRDNAYVAAGSTITKDVPAGALAIGRGRQRNIEGWVARRKKSEGRPSAKKTSKKTKQAG